MELQLEELKAPNEVHFTDGVPHPQNAPHPPPTTL